MLISKEIKNGTFTIVKRNSNFLIERNNKFLKTPDGNLISIPYKKIVQLILTELNKKTTSNDSVTYIKITNSAIDKIIKDKDSFINKIASQIHSDTICYFSKTPESLLQLQIDSWKPLLKWIKKTYSVELNYSYSFEPLIQNKNNIQIIKEILVGCDVFKLSGISTLCQLTGSLVISLALCDSRLTYEEAFRASQLEESYQLSRWGKDSEASNRRKAISADIYKASNYLDALRLE